MQLEALGERKPPPKQAIIVYIQVQQDIIILSLFHYDLTSLTFDLYLFLKRQSHGHSHI